MEGGRAARATGRGSAERVGARAAAVAMMQPSLRIMLVAYLSLIAAQRWCA